MLKNKDFYLQHLPRLFMTASFSKANGIYITMQCI